MSVRYVCKWCVVSALLALGLSFGLNKALFAQPVPADAEEGVQVLTRGPVHEAFAETVTYDPEPGMVMPTAPPAPIEEVPPEQRLEGANVAWIPGYWAWDDERNDFLWVSGIWRALPPGRQWVPGYWGKSGQSYQWTSGYWADAQASEVEYLPEPPATVEVGPNIAASSADDTWLPGCWLWQNGRYAWRPGFWAAAQPNWVWVPAHYVWAPRGYVFVDGYWDYSIARRGVLFAPVYFNRGVYAQRGFSYSPTTVIDLAAFTKHLFLRPQYQHYYFGDYYAVNYHNAGFLPWFSFQANHFGYDPFFAHERWRNRQDSGWDRHLEADFQNRRAHENLRPPRTWADQRAMTARAVQGREESPVVAAPLDDLRRSKNSPLRFELVDPSQRRQFSQRAQEVQQLREERQKLEAGETGAAPAEPRPKDVAPGRVRLPRSPIVAKPVADLGQDHAPPKTFQVPPPDPKVEPKQRTTRSSGQPRRPTVNQIPPDQPTTQSQPPPAAKQTAPQPKRQPQGKPQDPQPRGKDPAGAPSAGSKQEKPKGKDNN